MDARRAGLREAFAGRLITDPETAAPFLTDWRRQWRGCALAVVQPDTAEDVAAVVRWCRETGTPLTPQGGNTGLSGGATPDVTGSSIVLSLARLNRIRILDPQNDTMTVEAGCVLQTVQEAAEAAGRLFPLSLAAEGSCTIGGVLSTNAGGTAVLRYGNARDLCLGLEVVTADGQLWNGLRALRKDNTGYDLRGLFIGAEGTLGVITAAVLKLFPKPAARVAALTAVASPDHALALFERARAHLGPALTAFELMSGPSIDIAARHFPDLPAPFSDPAPWCVLLEVSDLRDATAAGEVLTSLLETALDSGDLSDAVIAASQAQSARLWALREHLSEAQGREGRNIKHDVSVPISSIPAFIGEAEQAMGAAFPGLRPVVFGHMGDGNLHINISPPLGDPGTGLATLQPAVNDLIHNLVARYEGSISAEHGLGVLRRDEAARYKPLGEIALMRAIKQALDPQGLMNPGKVLP